MPSKLLLTLRTASVYLVSLLASASLAQTTIHVGSGQQYSTIQSGIDAAANGDTVLVAPGTYNENINFNGKAITVTSSGGAAVTVIDGGLKPGVATVQFVSGETSASVISNLTVRGGGDSIGSATSYGGIYVNYASPTVQHNTVTANSCYNIDVQFGSAAILDNEISGVLRSTQRPTYCPSSSGVYLGGLNGGPESPGSSLVGNTIEQNLTGSGITLVDTENVLILNNIIRNNATADPGSAVSVEASIGTVLIQNLIYGNTSTCGGAIAVNLDGGSASRPSTLVASNTIVDNVTPSTQGGSVCTAISQIYPDPYRNGTSGPAEVFVNNVVSGSTAYPAVNCSVDFPPSETIQPTFQNNILYNGGGPFFGSHCVDVSGKYNNSTAQPQFVNAAAGDYHLKSTSPGIDAGDNGALQTFLAMTGRTLATDFDGNPRIQNATGKGCLVDMGAYEVAGATGACPSLAATLQSSLNPSVYGQAVTFTMQLASANGVPTGNVQFADGKTMLGTESISSAGTSSLSTSTLSVGSHPITATYQPADGSGATTATLTQTVNASASFTALTCSPSTIQFSKTASLTASVTSGSGIPTGSIAFTDNGAPLATGDLVNGVSSATASVSYTGTRVGTHTITATYLPTGSFAGSSATCAESVTGLPTNAGLSVSSTSAAYGTPLILTAHVGAATQPGPSIPTGSVTFYNDTTAIAAGMLNDGIATATVSTLPGGTNDSLSCFYNGDAVYASSECNTVLVSITGGATELTLTSTPNPAYLTQLVTMTASLTALGGPVTSGSITFLDGSTQPATVLATEYLTSGAAVYTTSALPLGTHPITAIYNTASPSYNGSTSAVVNQVIIPGGFTIALSPASLTLRSGATGTAAIQLGSLGNFAGPLALSYGPLPLYAAASISPAAVTLTANGSGSATLTVGTLVKSSRSTAPKLGARGPALLLAALALFCVPAGASRRGRLARLVGLALMAVSLQAMTGCSNAYYIADALAAGTYQLPVTATDVNHNSQTATLTVIVTP